MVTRTKAKRMTAEEFFDWVQRPENQGKDFELVRGEVVEMSRPGEQHCLVCANAARILGNYMVEQRRGYVLSNDPGTILKRDPDTVRGPDVVYHSKSRPYRDMNPKFSEGVPDLAVEVVSPNDRIGRMTKRIGEFLEAGMKMVWLMDPEAREVMVYRPDQVPVVLDEKQEISGDDVLPGFRCRVADFFFSPEETPSAAPESGTTSRPKRRPRGNRGS